jgi:hypothetical protein
MTHQLETAIEKLSKFPEKMRQRVKTAFDNF